MTFRYLLGAAAGLLLSLAGPSAAAGQQHSAGLQATARVLPAGFRVTPEVVTLVLRGERVGCATAGQACAWPAVFIPGTAVLRTGLATVRGSRECAAGALPACRAVVTVQFLSN